MRSISDDTSWMQVDQKRGRLVHPRRLLLLCDLASLAFGATYIYIEARGILGSRHHITVFNCILILALALALLLSRGSTRCPSDSRRCRLWPSW